MRIFSNIADIVRSTATPGSFACSIHPGRWGMFPHLLLLDRALTDLARGRLSRLVVQMPPRHGKSTLGSQFFPAWYLGTFPDRQIILTSATNELAVDFSMAARDILREHGPSVFGVRLRDRARARHRWQVEGGGGLRAAGVGGSIMGRGADLLIVDDYCKNVEEALSDTQRRKVHQWFLSTSSTRLSPRGAVVIIATRWHPRDLIGQLLLDAERGGEAYHVIRLPALAEPGDALGRLPGMPLWPQGFDELGHTRPQFDLEWLEARRAAYVASGYEWMWNALYQQNPPETLDAEFRADYFGEHIWFDEWPGAAMVVDRVMALDPSLGAGDSCDYSAFVMLMLDRQGILWIEADLDRRDAHRIAVDAVRLGHGFNPLTFCVEANGFQQLLADGIARLSREAGFSLPVTPWSNTANKATRIRGLAPYLARGEFRFRRRSPGTALLVEQLKSFPSAKHDDGPDALAMALEAARERFFAGSGGGRPEGELAALTPLTNDPGIRRWAGF
jgi:predicted phage terminase large subunit-like protein